MEAWLNLIPLLRPLGDFDDEIRRDFALGQSAREFVSLSFRFVTFLGREPHGFRFVWFFISKTPIGVPAGRPDWPTSLLRHLRKRI